MRQIVKGLVVVGFSILMLGLAEFLLRAIYPEDVIHIWPRLREDSAFQFNPDYLISLKPNIQKTYQRDPRDGGQTIRWHTNSEGFRGPPLREADYRIQVYGDSHIQARFSKLENTFSRRLEVALSRPDRTLEVVNGGVVGFGPDQSLIRLERESDRYRPNMVLVVLSDNDFGDLLRNRLLELVNSEKLVRSSYPAVPDRGLYEQAGHYQEDFPRHFLASLLLTRKLLELFSSPLWSSAPDDPWARLRLTRAEYSIYKSRRPRYFSHFADHYDIDVATDPESESSRAKIRLMKAVLREARDFCKARGIAFLVVLLPSAQDLASHALLSGGILDQFPRYLPARLTDTQEQICRVLGIPTVNLFRAFSDQGADALYLRGDDHWNDAGQLLAAQETAAFIQTNFSTDF